MGSPCLTIRRSNRSPLGNAVKDFPMCHSPDFPCFPGVCWKCAGTPVAILITAFRLRVNLGRYFPQLIGISGISKILNGVARRGQNRLAQARTFSPRRGSNMLAQGRATRRKPRRAALGHQVTVAAALKGRNRRLSISRPFRATVFVASLPRAALRGSRRVALPLG